MTKYGELVPMTSFIPSNIRKDATDIALLLRDGTKEDHEHIIELMKQYDPASIFGFMLYSRAVIAQFFWKSIVHSSTSFDMSQYTQDTDAYIDYLTEIWEILSGNGSWEIFRTFRPNDNDTRSLAKQLRAWLPYTLQSIGRKTAVENLKAQGAYWTRDEKKAGDLEGKAGKWVKPASVVSFDSDGTEEGDLAARRIDAEADAAIRNGTGIGKASRISMGGGEAEIEAQEILDILEKMNRRGELDLMYGKNNNFKQNPDKIKLRDYLAAIIDPETPEAVVSKTSELAKYLGVSYKVLLGYQNELPEIFRAYGIDNGYDAQGNRLPDGACNFDVFMDLVKFYPERVLAAIGFHVDEAA